MANRTHTAINIKDCHILKTATLNVCGLKRRSKFPECIEFVQKHDIVLVTETKLDTFDVMLTLFLTIHLLATQENKSIKIS